MKIVHEMGTARMGRDPKISILNSNNQIWDVKNVFVTDGGMYDIKCLPKPVANLHGADGKSSKFCCG